MLKTYLAVCALSCALLAPGATARETSRMYTVPYSQDTVALEGRLVVPIPGKPSLPVIVLFPDWMGITETALDEARLYAGWGYAVFVADTYGKNAQPKTQEEAVMRAGALKGNLALLRARATAALETAKRQTIADTSRVITLGYCFGGMVALELARSGAPLQGTVSVHGNLKSATPGEARKIQGPVLVLHGADDPFVPREEVDLFRDEMKKAAVDWQLVEYGGAVHAFTNPRAGTDPSKGVAYNAVATRRAHTALKAFFEETLRPGTQESNSKRK